MTYKESVSWLFSQFPAYQHVGVSAYKPDLDNVLELCAYFEVDYSKLKFIHVAGTNGKGSTCNFLASILQEANYKTGLFTSPHILDFRERIRVNGKQISEQKVIGFCEKVKKSHFKVKPSFFEITWLLALIHFIDSECEICVIETGLGGRLDATNIITPILSIITNIGLDHTAILGNTLAEIAFEKAGIIKENVPLVLGETREETFLVFQKKAKEMQAKIHLAENYQLEKTFFPENSYQNKNEKTVCLTVELLNEMNFKINPEKVTKGFQNVFENTGFMGRMQVVSHNPKIIVDAAHNSEGIKQLLSSIQNLHFKKVYVIYGASNDKNVDEILALFPENFQINLCQFSNLRSLNYEELKGIQQKNPQISRIYRTIEDAIKNVQKTVNEEDIILVTGSFFLLSDFFSFFPTKNLSK